MAVVTPDFVDTSVFIEGLIDFGPASEKSGAIIQSVVEGRLRDGQTAWHCCLEFYAVSTRLPEEFRLTPEDAQRMITRGILGNFAVHQLSGPESGAFLTIAARDGLNGGRIYDAHIPPLRHLSAITSLRPSPTLPAPIDSGSAPISRRRWRKSSPRSSSRRA